MGTGISSILLYNLPFQFTGLTIIADCIFGLNVLLLCIFLCMSIVRYIAWPQVFNTMLRHPQQSLFLGTFPMGLATVINMVVLACVPAWGLNWAILAWILWWVDAFISILTCFGLRFVMFAYHTQSIEKMNAVWLLPVVAPIVAASTGGTVASVLPESHARLTIVVSYILWGTGVPTAMLILTVYFYRLSVHKLPESSLIVSVFLPLGPFGQGAYGIMQLAKVTRSLALSDGLGWLIPNSDVTSSSSRSLSMADSLFAMSLVVALVMWGFGLFWLVIALLSIAKAQRFPFNMGWWGFTFPLVIIFGIFILTIGGICSVNCYTWRRSGLFCIPHYRHCLFSMRRCSVAIYWHSNFH